MQTVTIDRNVQLAALKLAVKHSFPEVLDHAR
jgi:hypothetical protein